VINKRLLVGKNYFGAGIMWIRWWDEQMEDVFLMASRKNKVGFILGFVPLPSFCMLMGSYLLEGT
jgi:hypothetical protein